MTQILGAMPVAQKMPGGRQPAADDGAFNDMLSLRQPRMPEAECDAEPPVGLMPQRLAQALGRADTIDLLAEAAADMPAPDADGQDAPEAGPSDGLPVALAAAPTPAAAGLRLAALGDDAAPAVADGEAEVDPAGEADDTDAPSIAREGARKGAAAQAQPQAPAQPQAAATIAAPSGPGRPAPASMPAAEAAAPAPDAPAAASAPRAERGATSAAAVRAEPAAPAAARAEPATTTPAPAGVVVTTAQSAPPAATPPGVAVAATLGADPAWAAYFRDIAVHGGSAPVNSLRIQLHPAELGIVTAHLRIEGDAIAVDIQAETAEAQRHLSGDAATIARALRAVGMDVANVTVHLAGQAGGDGQPQGGARSFAAEAGSQGGGNGTGNHRQDNGGEGGNAQAGPVAGDRDRPGGDRYI